MAVPLTKECDQCGWIGDFTWPLEDGGSPVMVCGACNGTGKKTAITAEPFPIDAAAEQQQANVATTLRPHERYEKEILARVSDRCLVRTLDRAINRAIASVQLDEFATDESRSFADSILLPLCHLAIKTGQWIHERE